MKKQKHFKKYTLKLSSFYPDRMDKLILNWKKLGTHYNFILKGPVFLPQKKKLFTVLKSPHIDKKAREQFSLISYHRSCSFQKSLQQKKLNKFIELVKNTLPPEVSLSIKCEHCWERNFSKRKLSSNDVKRKLSF